MNGVSANMQTEGSKKNHSLIANPATWEHMENGRMRRTSSVWVRTAFKSCQHYAGHSQDER